MYKMKREPILPVKTRQDFHNIEKETPNLSGFVHVNAIPEKQPLRSKSHLVRTVTQTENISGHKNVKYVNQKQEQFHRLHRPTKIQDNAKWSELLKKQTEKGDPQNYLQRIKQTNKAIDEANSELQNVNFLMHSRRNELKPKRVEPTIIENKGDKTKVSKSSEVEKNHKCARGVHSNTMDMLSKTFDKKLNVDINKEQEKQRRLNKARNKKLDQTITLMNEKLNQARGKYFNNDYETNHITSIINKKSKYQSIKDIMNLEKNSVRMPSMEASKLLQSDLENDLKKLRSSSPILNQTDERMNVIYENLEFLQSDAFQDDFSDLHKYKKYVKNKVCSSTPRPAVPCILNSNKLSIKTVGAVQTNNYKQLPKSRLKAVDTSEIRTHSKRLSTDTNSEQTMTKYTRKPLLMPQNLSEITSVSTDTKSDHQLDKEMIKNCRKPVLTSPKKYSQSKSTSMSEETDSEHLLEQQVKRSSFLRKEFGLGSGYDITKPISRGLDFLLS